jgi:TatD DNase family protein
VTFEELQKKEYLIDTHAHLNYRDYDSVISTVLSAANENGVLETFDVSTDLDTSKKSLELSENNTNIKSFIGVDPEIFIPGSELFKEIEVSSTFFNETKAELKRLFEQNKNRIVGFGETGLDYYWMNKDENVSVQDKENSKRLQEELFRLHLELASETNTILTIHSRGAEERCLEISKEYNCRGIFHSYTGSLETAKKILDVGWGLGVNGIVTFKNASELREMYSSVLGKLKDPTPNDFYKKGIFFETDSPFLSPEGKRGELNSPANVRIIFDQFVKSLS